MNHSQYLKLGICATTSLLLGVGCGAKAVGDEGNGNTSLPSDDAGNVGGQSSNAGGAGNTSADTSSTNSGGTLSSSATGGRGATGGASTMSTGGRTATGSGGASVMTTGGTKGIGGATAKNTATTKVTGGASSSGGRTSATGGVSNAAGMSSTGGAPAAGGTAATGGTTAGSPVIGDNGFVTVSAGTIVLSGYVSSYIGGSGSSVSLTYDASSFCASGTVAPNSTYNSWAGVGFNVNQTQGGSSGSTGKVVLTGSTISISYKNIDGSPLELQLWDGSDYWCYYVPPSTVPTTVTVPLSSLNTQCWNNGGTAFTSGTPISTVQLVVPGTATTTTPFDYCFLGLTVQ